MEIWKYPVTFLLMNISFGSIVLLVSSLHLRRHQKLSFLRQLFVRLSQLLPLLLLLPFLMPHNLETGLVQQKVWMRSQPKTLILGWYRALIWFDWVEMCGVSVRQIILDEPALKTKYDAFFQGILCIPPNPSLRVAKRGGIGRFRLEVLIALHPAQADSLASSK